MRESMEQEGAAIMHKMLIISLVVMASVAMGVSFVGRISSLPHQHAGSSRDDQAITTNIVSACRTAFAGTAMQMHVDTHEGIVQLKGVVDDERTANKAIEIALSTPGVLRVESTFVIIPEGDTDGPGIRHEQGLSI